MSITAFFRTLASRSHWAIHSVWLVVLAGVLCANVVEMTPNREHNFCCSAGGGIINCGPPFKSVRMEGNRVKADQLRNTGVHTVVAPCHNCHGGLEDIIKHYKLGMHTKFIGDLIYELMEKPEV